MPWNIKRQVALILLGVAAMVGGAIVLSRHRSFDLEVLAAGLFIGGLAMVIVALPGGGGNGPAT